MTLDQSTGLFTPEQLAAAERDKPAFDAGLAEVAQIVAGICRESGSPVRAWGSTYLTLRAAEGWSEAKMYGLLASTLLALHDEGVERRKWRDEVNHLHIALEAARVDRDRYLGQRNDAEAEAKDLRRAYEVAERYRLAWKSASQRARARMFGGEPS